MIERLQTDQKLLGFNPEPQRRQSDSALLEAHTIILEVLLVQQKRFNLEGFVERFDKCVEDWKEIHGVDDAGKLTRPRPSAARVRRRAQTTVVCARLMERNCHSRRNLVRGREAR